VIFFIYQLSISKLNIDKVTKIFSFVNKKIFNGKVLEDINPAVNSALAMGVHLPWPSAGGTLMMDQGKVSDIAFYRLVLYFNALTLNTQLLELADLSGVRLALLHF